MSSITPFTGTPYIIGNVASAPAANQDIGFFGTRTVNWLESAVENFNSGNLLTAYLQRAVARFMDCFSSTSTADIAARIGVDASEVDRLLNRITWNPADLGDNRWNLLSSMTFEDAMFAGSQEELNGSYDFLSKGIYNLGMDWTESGLDCDDIRSRGSNEANAGIDRAGIHLDAAIVDLAEAQKALKQLEPMLNKKFVPYGALEHINTAYETALDAAGKLQTAQLIIDQYY